MATTDGISDRELLMRVFETTTKLDTRLDYLENLLVDHRGSIKELEKKMAELEASKNKLLGMCIAVSVVGPVVWPYIGKILGVH